MRSFRPPRRFRRARDRRSVTFFFDLVSSGLELWSALFSPSAPRPTYLPRPCARSAAGATYLPTSTPCAVGLDLPTCLPTYPTCHVAPYHRDYSKSAEIPTLSEVSIGFSIKFWV